MIVLDRLPQRPDRQGAAPTWHVQCPECLEVYSLTCQPQQARETPRCAKCAAKIHAKSKRMPRPVREQPEQEKIAQPRTQTQEGSPPKQGSEPRRDSAAASNLETVLARARIHAELDVLMLVARRDRWARYGWRKPDYFDRQRVERLLSAYVRLDLAHSVHQASGREASACADAIALVEGRGPDVPERIEARGGHETQPVALVDDELEGPRGRDDHHIQHDDNLGTSLRRVNR